MLLEFGKNCKTMDSSTGIRLYVVFNVLKAKTVLSKIFNSNSVSLYINNIIESTYVVRENQLSNFTGY